MLAATGATVLPLQPARAVTTLVCETNNPSRPANAPVNGLGSAEHATLQNDLYIPEHEARCPTTVASQTFEEAPESIAISYVRQGSAFYAGLNQPLSAADWSRMSPVLHLPLMMDGFVVVAITPCSYYMSDVPPVKLSSLTLSLLYSGAITKWNDPLLVADNPWIAGCPLADARPTMSVRTGDAWSTAVLKDYLSKTNPAFEVFEQRERLDEWPATLDVGCWGDSEADMVDCMSRFGAISYMRYSTAKAYGLAPAQLTNANGVTPPPALDPADTWPSACPGSVPLGDWKEPRTFQPVGQLLDWSTFSMTNGKGYPLCAFSYVVTPLFPRAAGPSQSAWDSWKDHLKVMWSVDMQQALKAEGYAPLPENLRLMVVNGPGVAG